jgi:hypothetical protein
MRRVRRVVGCRLVALRALSWQNDDNAEGNQPKTDNARYGAQFAP